MSSPMVQRMRGAEKRVAGAHLPPLLQPRGLLLLLPRRRAVVERDLRRFRLLTAGTNQR